MLAAPASSIEISKTPAQDQWSVCPGPGEAGAAALWPEGTTEGRGLGPGAAAPVAPWPDAATEGRGLSPEWAGPAAPWPVAAAEGGALGPGGAPAALSRVWLGTPAG